MEAMAEVFVKYLNINPSVKRMDSIMVSSSSKKMSRLEILYSYVQNMVKTINRTVQNQLLKNMEHYLNEEDRNETIYYRKNEEVSSRLQQVIEDADTLMAKLEENGSIITSYDYDVNSHSDSSFCKETIEKLGLQETKTTLIADGAYANTENVDLAAENNIELVTTALLGKTPDIIQASFQIDSSKRQVIKCPAGYKPYKTSYYEET